jgi:hypothetical protein
MSSTQPSRLPFLCLRVVTLLADLSEKTTMSKHVGTWRLTRAEAVDANGNPVAPPFGGESAIGRLVLTAHGRLSASITDARTTIPPGQAREYSCYAGPYRFDGQTLVTTVDSCSDPARMGTEQVRDVHFESALMVLQPPLRAYGDKPAERRTLWWEKLADV